MKRASGRPVDLSDIAALTEPEHDTWLAATQRPGLDSGSGSHGRQWEGGWVNGVPQRVALNPVTAQPS